MGDVIFDSFVHSDELAYDLHCITFITCHKVISMWGRIYSVKFFDFGVEFTDMWAFLLVVFPFGSN